MRKGKKEREGEIRNWRERETEGERDEDGEKERGRENRGESCVKTLHGI